MKWGKLNHQRKQEEKVRKSLNFSSCFFNLMFGILNDS